MGASHFFLSREKSNFEIRRKADENNYNFAFL